MAITIDYGNTNIINIPKADLTLVGGTLYELDTEWFRLALKDIEDSEAGIAFPTTHIRNAPVTVAGTTLAQTLEILYPYSVQFEDGSYTVRLAGSNNNLFDVENGILVQNSVQVIAQNSAGLVNVNFLIQLQQEALFQGCVHIDTFGSTNGTEFPRGTASEPVNNLADAVTIANRIGVRCLKLTGLVSLDRAFAFWDIRGLGAVAEVDVNGQDISGTRFEACGVSGICGTLTQKVVIDLGRISPAGLTNYVGVVSRSVFDGNLSLAAGDTSLIQCSSNIVGVDTPIIDAQNVDVTLSVRQWIGGFELRNFSLPTCVASFDLIPGHLVLASTVTDGDIVLRGMGKFTNNAGAGVTLDDAGFVDGRDVHFAGDAAIHIDSVSGNDANDGRSSSPVQTAAAAKILADNLGIAEYHFKGSITLTSVHDRWTFIGASAQFNDVLNLNNQSVDESRAQGCRLSGDALESQVEALFCEIDNPGNLYGVFRQCGLLNTFKIEATAPRTYVFHHCFSQVAGSGRPVLNFTNLAITHNVQFRNYVGGLDVINMVQGNLSIDSPSGTIDLKSTITGGDIVVRGQGLFINNAGGISTVTDGFQNWTDFYLSNQILAGKAIIAPDDLSVQIFDKDLVTVIKTLNRTADGRTRTPI